jgi:hypothetical protein
MLERKKAFCMMDADKHVLWKSVGSERREERDKFA